MADLFSAIEQWEDMQYKALRNEFKVSRRCAKTRRAIKKTLRRRTRAKMKAIELKEQYRAWCEIEAEEEDENFLQELMEHYDDYQDDYTDWYDEEIKPWDEDDYMDDPYDQYDPWPDFFPDWDFTY